MEYCIIATHTFHFNVLHVPLFDKLGNVWDVLNLANRFFGSFRTWWKQWRISVTTLYVYVIPINHNLLSCFIYKCSYLYWLLCVFVHVTTDNNKKKVEKTTTDGSVMAVMAKAAKILFDFFFFFHFPFVLFLFDFPAVVHLVVGMECHRYYHRYHLTDIIRRHNTQVFNDWNDDEMCRACVSTGHTQFALKMPSFIHLMLISCARYANILDTKFLHCVHYNRNIFRFSQYSFACQDFKNIIAFEWNGLTQIFPFIFEMCVWMYHTQTFWLDQFGSKSVSVWEIFNWKNSLLSLTGLIINRLIAHKILCCARVAIEWILMKRISCQNGIAMVTIVRKQSIFDWNAIWMKCILLFVIKMKEKKCRKNKQINKLLLILIKIQLFI